MNQIQVNARFTNIARSDLAAFKEAAARALQIAEGEPGVVQYDWFFDDTRTVCFVRETYQDSEALLAHGFALGRLLDALSELGGGCELEMFGHPAPAVLDATASLRRTVFRTAFQGK
jgi:quinol monooxygenase YgiN